MRAPSVLAGFAPRVRTSSAAPRRSGGAASSACASEAPTMSARTSTAGTRAAHTTRPPAPPPPTSTASAVRTAVSGDTTIPTGERGTVATAPTSPAELSTVPTPLAATSRSQPACTSMSSLPPLPVRNQRSSSSATGTISARVATLRAPPRRVAARTRDVARRSSRCPAASWTTASSSPISTTLAWTAGSLHDTSHPLPPPPIPSTHSARVAHSHHTTVVAQPRTQSAAAAQAARMTAARAAAAASHAAVNASAVSATRRATRLAIAATACAERIGRPMPCRYAVRGGGGAARTTNFKGTAARIGTRRASSGTARSRSPHQRLPRHAPAARPSACAPTRSRRVCARATMVNGHTAPSLIARAHNNARSVRMRRSASCRLASAVRERH